MNLLHKNHPCDLQEIFTLFTDTEEIFILQIV